MKKINTFLVYIVKSNYRQNKTAQNSYAKYKCLYDILYKAYANIVEYYCGILLWMFHCVMSVSDCCIVGYVLLHCGPSVDSWWWRQLRVRKGFCCWKLRRNSCVLRYSRLPCPRVRGQTSHTIGLLKQLFSLYVIQVNMFWWYSLIIS